MVTVVAEKKFKDLLSFAQKKWRFDENRVRDILKGAGCQEWKSENWDRYVAILQGYVDRLKYEREQKRILSELIYQGNNLWDLDEIEVFTVINQEGWIDLRSDEIHIYYDKLRWFWLKKCINQKTEWETRKERLLQLEKTLEIVVEPDGWKYVGTPEALDAHWELEDMRRRERRRKTKWSMIPSNS